LIFNVFRVNWGHILQPKIKIMNYNPNLIKFYWWLIKDCSNKEIYSDEWDRLFKLFSYFLLWGKINYRLALNILLWINDNIINKVYISYKNWVKNNKLIIDKNYIKIKVNENNIINFLDNLEWVNDILFSFNKNKANKYLSIYLENWFKQKLNIPNKVFYIKPLILLRLIVPEIYNSYKNFWKKTYYILPNLWEEYDYFTAFIFLELSWEIKINNYPILENWKIKILFEVTDKLINHYKLITNIDNKDWYIILNDKKIYINWDTINFSWKKINISWKQKDLINIILKNKWTVTESDAEEAIYPNAKNIPNFKSLIFNTNKKLKMINYDKKISQSNWKILIEWFN